jgi:hypothetical protein
MVIKRREENRQDAKIREERQDFVVLFPLKNPLALFSNLGAC